MPVGRSSKYKSNQERKEAKREYNKKYYNSPKGKKNKEIYYQDNREELINKSSEYARKNRKKINERTRKRKKLRMEDIKNI